VRVLGCDAFHLGAVSGFTVAQIAGHHAVLVQEMQVLILTPHAHKFASLTLSKIG